MLGCCADLVGLGFERFVYLLWIDSFVCLLGSLVGLVAWLVGSIFCLESWSRTVSPMGFPQATFCRPKL